jgi:hypothetical protein
LDAEQRESILESLKEARKYADPSSPQPVRLMAANGALPLPPTQISTVLYLLSQDEDAGVRAKARTSLEGLPERVLEPTLCGEVPAELLEVLAELNRDNPQRLEKIALNPHTSDHTFCLLASLPHGRIVDIVSHNQTRLLRCPKLLEALGDNPVTSPATLDRVLEFLGLPGATKAEPAVEMPEPAVGTADPGSRTGDPSSEKGIPPDLLDGVPEEQVQRNPSLIVRITSMTIMQKIKLARFGSAEARSVLVRDKNKIVATAVTNSPKLSEQEVLVYCKNKSLPEEVVRIIAHSRRWTKNRAIQYHLCFHPKTPIAYTMKFLNNLTDLELKTISKSKDVADEVSVHAKRILAKKGKA